MIKADEACQILFNTIELDTILNLVSSTIRKSAQKGQVCISFYKKDFASFYKNHLQYSFIKEKIFQELRQNGFKVIEDEQNKMFEVSWYMNK